MARTRVRAYPGYAYTHVRAYVRTRVRAYALTRACAYACTPTRAYMRTHIRAYGVCVYGTVRAYVCTRVRSQPQQRKQQRMSKVSFYYVRHCAAPLRSYIQSTLSS